MYQHTIKGLTAQQVIAAREQFGTNALKYKQQSRLVMVFKSIAGEPMVVLLLAASILYFVSGQAADGAFLAAAIILIAIISLYQSARSRNALKKLEAFSTPLCRVVRDGAETEIKTEDLVIGDYMIVDEGKLIMADGIIVQSNDFSVNESILTGEAFSVFKDKDSENNTVYSGTQIASGLAIVKVTKTGNSTELGKIGGSLSSIAEEKTPLELQINNFVRIMVIVGGIIFVAVWVLNYTLTGSFTDSLLKALTLAMSLLPEEIPVAFTAFMALGAWRLMKLGIVVKQMKTVETLGSATVICIDKTGTITQNKMTLSKLYDFAKHSFVDTEEYQSAGRELITAAMWASEPIPFDPMEKALHEAYADTVAEDQRPQFKMVHEYPLEGHPPMMTHIFENGKAQRITAAKGAPEAIMSVCELSAEERTEIEEAVTTMAAEGYRVLGVGLSGLEGSNFPAKQQQIAFKFIGLIAFNDPPKDNIAAVISDFYKAGIDVKIITGDNALTTAAIAKQIGFKGYEHTMTGDELMLLSDPELKVAVMNFHVFSRMFPEAKLRIVNALKADNQIVAMTGDGVNDAPALKAAHIGIAMGKRGTAIAKDAASLILVDDDLSKMVEAVAMGRKIYTNLKKAIQYIVSIHIPIILTVFIPLVLGWVYPAVFSPLHVILLELIMGPTCSIIYENEPIEPNAMVSKPRPFGTTFFHRNEVIISVIQGLVITVGILSVYQLSVHYWQVENSTRAMVFVTLMSANIFLTLVNRSFYYSVITTLRYKNLMVGYIILVTIVLMVLLLTVPPLMRLFEFDRLTLLQWAIAFSVGALSVLWFELVKWYRRGHASKSRTPDPSKGHYSQSQTVPGS